MQLKNLANEKSNFKTNGLLVNTNNQSMLKSLAIDSYVKSYTSAHNGCLDVRYRRRTRGAAISFGELLTKL